ncbi:histidine kinase [Rhodobacteraceae bacterium B1Z28]|uniref:Histidine kinase n=1 Tax=Ruegeria haliotis TaxID=2747601 RepID=A0ABX2PSU4_9RHOB|nr:histidine kinase [Ruegeria haliotis]NVO56731.1 histidine kinase [Ruegeria haliotis]
MQTLESKPRDHRGIRLGSNMMFALASLMFFLAYSVPRVQDDWSFAPMISGLVYVVLAAIVMFVWRPLLLQRNRALGFIIVTGVTIVVFAVIDESLDLFLYPPDSGRHSFDLRGLIFAVVNGWTIVITVMALVLFADIIEERRRVAQLEQLRKSAQLTALRQQLNPHILLNGLNNIYSLAARNSPDAAPAILELTDILRYALYEADDRAVPLDREVELLHNFIAMQKLGLEDRVSVTFEICGDTANIPVAPLIFLPIVENAFKHGADTDQSDPAQLAFRLNARPGHITFESKNPLIENTSPTEVLGVGLNNVRARLDLAYEDRYSLTTQSGDSTFRVAVTMDGAPK